MACRVRELEYESTHFLSYNYQRTGQFMYLERYESGEHVIKCIMVKDLVITYRVNSDKFDSRLLATLSQEMPHAMNMLDSVRPDSLKLVESRIVVHHHGGRIRIDEGGNGQWHIRLFFPYAEGEEQKAVGFRSMSA